MVKEDLLILIDDEGNETEMEILFTIENEEYGKQYVYYVDPKDDSGQVFVSHYTEDGQLFDIEDEKEWAMIEEVFSAFVIKHEEQA